jgi:single-stranded-DNA-specific exonuclease
MKCWRFSVPDKAGASRLSSEYGIPPFLALLLAARGISSPEEIERYRDASEWYDPMLLPDMDKAVERVRQALDNFEPVLVYGDYDADGVTATAILYSYLYDCGANVRFGLPDRESGYGLNMDVIDRAAAEGIRLIITVDNGVSATEEIAYAKSLGIDTVVTDHHKPPETLPKAVAVVDPHCRGNRSPFVPLCGAGVAFKLIAAMEETGERLPEELLDQFADLVAMGTIGDIVPLQGENRLLVQAGLQKLAQPDRTGVRSLLRSASLQGTSVSAGNVGYGLVPRINAMGRLYTCEQVVQLLLTEDEETADAICATMDEANQQRQKEENTVVEAAEAVLRQEPRRMLERVLVVWGDGWHPGVLGIAAARLTEKYGKPTVLISVRDGTATGSCRSIAGFSIIDALTSCAPLLTRFGGHTMAAGFALPEERLPELMRGLQMYAAQQGEMPLPQLNIDCKLNPAGLSLSLVEEIREMEPFGAGNPTPVFALTGMELTGIQPVGGGKHLRLSFTREGHDVQAMLFRTAPEQFPYIAGDRLDLAVTLDQSMYRGVAELSVIIRDYRPEGFDAEPLLRQKQSYEAHARGEQVPVREMIPDRNQIAAVYRLFRAEEDRPRSMSYFCYRLRAQQIGYDRLTVALVALRQLGLIRVMRDGENLRIRINPVEHKVNLEEAPVLNRLREAREHYG